MKLIKYTVLMLLVSACGQDVRNFYTSPVPSPTTKPSLVGEYDFSNCYYNSLASRYSKVKLTINDDHTGKVYVELFTLNDCSDASPYVVGDILLKWSKLGSNAYGSDNLYVIDEGSNGIYVVNFDITDRGVTASMINGNMSFYMSRK